MSPKPSIPKNIIAKVIVNTNLSFAVILCSSLIINGLFVVLRPNLPSFNLNQSTFQYKRNSKTVARCVIIVSRRTYYFKF